MKRNFTDENFEGFLRQNADGLRMPPADRVWKGISRHLNQRKRRLGFLIAFSLLISGGTGYYLMQDQDHSTELALGKTPTISEKHAIPFDGAQLQLSNGNREVEKYSPVHRTTSASIASISKPELNKQTAENTATVETPATDLPAPFEGTIADSYYGDESNSSNTSSALATENKKATDPQTIESVWNVYVPMKHKVGLMVYFTPSVSYRKLSDNNIDNVVTHKPDFGFELGMTSKYRLSKNMKLKAGVQFNVNRYAIKTFSSSTELATIRLRNYDSLSTATNYNNFSGYKSNWLENFYLQVSAPVGVELKLKGDEHMQFGIATTLQPTYVLGDRAYVISTDYKNYAEVPRLTRRWNMNANLETFVSYSTGHLKWQVGPQIRYQLLSSFVKTYPVKENLFDFGLKVGIALNNQ